MLHALQQTAPAANPSAADVAGQIREQVLQQLKDAGVAQKARSEADRAAQTTIRHGGKTIVIETPGALQAPLAPIPTTTVPPSLPEDAPFDIPRRVESLGYAFLLMLAVIAIGKPLARALGSIIERRALRPAMPQEFGARLERIEHGIEAVSIEIERISESQRYLLKVHATPERVEIPRSAS
jgi:hypothetical protein